MTVVARLAEHARVRPRDPAFSISGEDGDAARLDWGTLAARVAAAARALAARGVAAGDRVALVLPTSPELLTLILATQARRAVPMVVNPQLPDEAVRRRAALVEAALVVDATLAATLAGAPGTLDADGEEDDLAYLQLTSGTTGEPRAAAVTHRSLSASLESSRAVLGIRDGDVLVAWVPLHHDLGLVRFVFAPVHFGLHAHLLPASLASLGPWLRTMTRERATITGAPDFAYRLAARTISPDGIDLAALRFATNGGEPVRASSIAAFEERFGCPGAIRPGYGLAEATLGVAMAVPGEPLRVDARGHVGCGRPAPGLDVRVTREGVAVATGELGDLEVAGSPLFAGYFTPRGLDRSAFTADGWLRTGDTGYLDAGGQVFVLGRTRAMVKQGGALIAPREVEEVVDAVPGVRLSAAIGMTNPTSGGEELVVVVEPRDPEGGAALVEPLIAALRSRVGVVPARVVPVPARTIPRTASGKLRYDALRALLKEPASG